MQQRFADLQRETGIAARHRMAYAIAFVYVEKQDLIRLGYSLVVTKVPHIDASIRKHQLGSGRVLFFALLPVAALATHVAYNNGWGLQQRLNGKFSQADSLSRY